MLTLLDFSLPSAALPLPSPTLLGSATKFRMLVCTATSPSWVTANMTFLLIQAWNILAMVPPVYSLEARTTLNELT